MASKIHSSLPSIPFNHQETLPKKQESIKINDHYYDYPKGDGDWWKNSQKTSRPRFVIFEMPFHIFRPDNPIHEFFRDQAEFFSPETIRWAYNETGRILQEVRRRVVGKDLSPQDKLKTVYDVMEDFGYKIGTSEHFLLISDLKFKTLDCDSSSDILLIVSHEMGWPTFPVELPGHVFARWEEGQWHFNMDKKWMNPDSAYQEGRILRQEGSKLVVKEKADFFCVSNSHDEPCDQSLPRPNWEVLSLYSQAHAHEEIGNFEKSRQGYMAAQKSITAFANLGSLYVELGQFEQAVAVLTKVVRTFPQYSLAYYHRGLAYLELGKLEESRNDFFKVVELDPQESEAYWGLGLIYEREGELKAAEQYFIESAKINSSNQFELAKFYDRTGKLWQALVEYQKSLDTDPENAEILALMENVRSRLDQDDDTRRNFEPTKS